MEVKQKPIDLKRYGRLLAKVLPLPRPLNSDEECDRLLAVIEPMMNKELTPEEDALFKLLVVLVTDYEDRTVHIPASPPDQLLRHILKNSGMKQVELAKLWGTSKGYTSNVVNGKRPISKAQARILAERFKISMEAFL